MGFFQRAVQILACAFFAGAAGSMTGLATSTAFWVVALRSLDGCGLGLLTGGLAGALAGAVTAVRSDPSRPGIEVRAAIVGAVVGALVAPLTGYALLHLILSAPRQGRIG
jgi:hypothetical protein